MDQGQLGPQLAAAFPESTIIAVHNGIDETDVPVSSAPYLNMWSPPGIRSALLYGYERYTGFGAEAGPLVRTDSDEHPLSEFESLAAQAIEIDGMVVGNLVYSNEFMLPETPDYLAQQLWNEMYSQITRGKIVVGNALGLQVFASPAVCERVVAAVKPVVEAVDQELGEPMQWGFDGIMILAAFAAKVPVRVVSIAGTVLRNRPSSKIVDQFSGHFTGIRMARAIYPHDFV